MLRRAQAELNTLYRWSKAVAILGARQVGKTTLARQFAAEQAGPVHFFDLEDPRHRRQLDNAMSTLEPLRGLIVLDEIQQRPELFPALRVLLDRPDDPARFLLLGSASGKLLQQGSESLAGRVGWLRLDGFELGEVGADSLSKLWLRGGFPRSFLAENDADSFGWRSSFLETFLARDLPMMGVTTPFLRMREFWMMLAHWSGRVLNHAELARAMGSSPTTVRNYLDVLCDAMVVRLLRPWFANLGKRLVKSPKVYVLDSGLLHTLHDIRTPEQLAGHPLVGSSFEGFALHQVQKRLGAKDEECWFWATHAGAELDLLVVRGDRRLGFEFKRSEEPTTTRSMHAAMQDLQLERLDVVHLGPSTWWLRDGIRALSIHRLQQDLDRLD
ncbi:MAG: ATP-binding protein [Planctomycetota bacterium]